MTTADLVVRDVTAVLSDAGVAAPRVDAELLLAHVLGVEVGEVRRRVVLGAPVADAERSALDVLAARRAAREPLQHLTGVAPFRHLELAVGPGVFVPRPETEIVAQVVIDEARRVTAGPGGRGVGTTAAGPGAGRSSAPAVGPDAATADGLQAFTSPATAVVVDLCTGSGAIALAVATEVRGARVHAVELDADAHAWAARNIRARAGDEPVGRPGTRSADTSGESPDDDGAGPVRLVKGDARTALTELDGRVDVVVSNPPYVPPDAVPRDPEVARHDPGVALYGLGADGLEVPRGIASAAARLLRPGGLFVMEHAESQADAARELVAAVVEPGASRGTDPGRSDGARGDVGRRHDTTDVPAFERAETRADLTGRPRMVVARRRAPSES